MDASAFGVAITSLPYEMVPNYFTWDGASGVWVRFCVSDATFSQDAAADEGDAAVVRSVRVLGVVGEWWGGQSTLFVTLIDLPKHFTFLHLIDPWVY